MFLKTFKLVYQQPSQGSTSSYDYEAYNVITLFKKN